MSNFKTRPIYGTQCTEDLEDIIYSQNIQFPSSHVKFQLLIEHHLQVFNRKEAFEGSSFKKCYGMASIYRMYKINIQRRNFESFCLSTEKSSLSSHPYKTFRSTSTQQNLRIASLHQLLSSKQIYVHKSYSVSKKIRSIGINANSIYTYNCK